MARFKNKKRNVVVKSAVKSNKQLPTVDQITGKKIPQTMVFCRNKSKKLPPAMRQLEQDLRKVMLPYTALKLKEKKRNTLKDFVNVAGPMGVTHFLILSKDINPVLRVAKTPQGPTLHFKIHEYSLAVDVAKSQDRPRSPKDLFRNSPLLVLSGFGTQEEHLRLVSMMFQNMFPTIDVNTVKLSLCQRIVLLNYNKDTKLIEFRHYSIRLQPVGVSRRIRNIVLNRELPDLSDKTDVSEYLRCASESEGEDEAATVSLTSDLGRVNRVSTKSAVKLQEIGPRMTLELTRIEEGLCSGEVMFNTYGQQKDNEEVDEDEDEDEDEGEDEDGEEEEEEEEGGEEEDSEHEDDDDEEDEESDEEEEEEEEE